MSTLDQARAEVGEIHQILGRCRGPAAGPLRMKQKRIRLSKPDVARAHKARKIHFFQAWIIHVGEFLADSAHQPSQVAARFAARSWGARRDPLPGNGRASMTYYRLYFLDRQTGRIENFDEFDVASDSEAIERADRQAPEAAVELWRGPKKVCRREPLRYPSGIAAPLASPKTLISA